VLFHWIAQFICASLASPQIFDLAEKAGKEIHSSLLLPYNEEKVL
jgi:hypothetical protein